MFGLNKQNNNEERLLDKQLDFQNKALKESNTYSQFDSNDQYFLDRKEGMQDLTRWQQDLVVELDNLYHDLKNYIKTEQGWIPATEKVNSSNATGEPVLLLVEVKPMVNEFGLNRIINIAKRYLNRNVMMSNLSDVIIARMMRDLVAVLTIHLGFNYKEYEIEYSDLPMIIKMVKDTVEPTLCRALNNGERSYLNTINKRVEAYNMTAEQEKKKFLGVF